MEQLIDRAGSALDPARVHSNTRGNPFYVSELLATGDRELPATVRDAVLARASRLSASARQVLAAAAVLGHRADVRLLVSVSGQSADAVDECMHRGMLVGDAGGWVFRHELARLAIEQTLSPAARIALHAAALRALGSAGAADDGRLAHHAERCGDQTAVLEHAPRAATRAARLGAHREAAEHYRLTLRFEGRSDENRASLFTALSYECYLIDELAEAYEARHAAMALFARTGDALAVGTAQRWLSRLSWFLGRNADSERYAAEAVATLEPLGDSRELAMAYSNQAQLCMVAGDVDGATRWGERAIELARRIGDREAEIHALNNVGTATASAYDSIEGLHRLAQSLDMALADDAHEHAARAYTNLGSIPVKNRRFADADRKLRAGIAYCKDRDLDAWALYMSSWLARSLAEQGRYAEADECVRTVLHHPRVSPITRITVHAVAGQLAARRGRRARRNGGAAGPAARAPLTWAACAARPAGGEPGKSVAADRARDGRVALARRRAVQRRGRQPPIPCREDGRPSRFGGPAQTRGAYPVARPTASIRPSGSSSGGQQAAASGVHVRWRPNWRPADVLLTGALDVPWTRRAAV